MSSTLAAIGLAVLGLVTIPAHAQSNLGELLDKGGRKLMREDYAALPPFRVQYRWPQGGGEGDLVYKADGTLVGTEYHSQTQSESTAIGTWTVDDNGRWCIKKTLAEWNSKTDVCWYSFRIGDEYFGGLSDSDRTSRVFKVKSTQKL